MREVGKRSAETLPGGAGTEGRMRLKIEHSNSLKSRGGVIGSEKMRAKNQRLNS